MLAAIPMEAQWLNYPAPGVPRTRDGKVNLAAKAPRDSRGRPDLSGVWHVAATTVEEWKRIRGPNYDALEVPGMELSTVSKYAFNLFADWKPEEIPERPAARAAREERLRSGVRDNPSVHCLPHGIPIQSLVSEVVKWIQAPGVTVVLSETDSTYRQIYTDGRPLPKDPQPVWLGYSTGRWEGDTLVVETAGFNDKSWLDLAGHSHSEALRVTERYRRRDYGHMDVEATFEDPAYYTKPFSIQYTLLLQGDSDILENLCNENEQDRRHLGIR
jgi:hypothetical protein